MGGLEMNDCVVPLGITAVACAIANEFEDSAELAVLAAVFVQLGDTLSTIAAQRAACRK